MIARLQNPILGAVASVLLSVALGVTVTWPKLQQAIVLAAAAAAEKAVVPVAKVAEVKQRGWDFWTIEIENLSNELKAERLRVAKQAEALEQRSARLAAEEKEFAKVRAEIDALRRKLAEQVVEVTADEAKNVRSLANTYTTMNAKAAVAIFAEMDDVTVVKILNAMKPDAVSPIFEAMTQAGRTNDTMARRAALLSEKLRLMKAARTASSP